MKDARTPLRPFVRRDDRMVLHVVLVLVVIYALLALFVVLAGGDTSFDQGITLFLQRYHSPFWDGLMEFVSWWAFPGGGVAILGVGLLFALRRRWLEAGFMFAPLLAVPLVSIIKQLVGRARPTAEVVRVVRQFNNESFPSGHVVFYTVLFGFIAYLMYRHWTVPKFIRIPLAAFSVFLIVTVPFSRMYLGAHWFTDVTAGFALGLLLLIGLVAVYNRVVRARMAKGAQSS